MSFDPSPPPVDLPVLFDPLAGHIVNISGFILAIRQMLRRCQRIHNLSLPRTSHAIRLLVAMLVRTCTNGPVGLREQVVWRTLDDTFHYGSIDELVPGVQMGNWQATCSRVAAELELYGIGGVDERGLFPINKHWSEAKYFGKRDAFLLPFDYSIHKEIETDEEWIDIVGILDKWTRARKDRMQTAYYLLEGYWAETIAIHGMRLPKAQSTREIVLTAVIHGCNSGSLLGAHKSHSWERIELQQYTGRIDTVMQLTGRQWMSFYLLMIGKLKEVFEL